MSVDVVMPQMGESITEGTVSKWLKQAGDRIEKDEPILEISTDKVDAEVPSPGAGILLKINVPEGETVEVGSVLAVIGEPSEVGSQESGVGNQEKAAAPAQQPLAKVEPEQGQAVAASTNPRRKDRGAKVQRRSRGRHAANGRVNY